MGILTILVLPIQEYWIYIHLFASSKITFKSYIFFSLQTSLVKFILKYFIVLVLWQMR